MYLWDTNPFLDLTLSHGRGCTVWDTDGKAYLDLHSGTWCNVLGNSHPKWLSAIREQAEKLTHTGASVATLEIEKALECLSQILPPQLSRAVFLNTGSEAVELALKMARAATGADKIVVIERGYYGATNYTLKLSEAGRSANYLPDSGNIIRLPAPHCRHCPFGYIGSCEGNFSCLDPLAELAQTDHSVAAVIYEPIMGGGIIIPPTRYGSRLRHLTSQCGAPLIAEEVTTGLGRTGRWFGFEHEAIVPDILVLGKALGAGLPVAATIATEEIHKQGQPLLGRHVQSHQNDPLSGRIAATVISILQEENLLPRVVERGAYLLEGLTSLKEKHSCIADIRGRGLMAGIELNKDYHDKGPELCRLLLQEGFLLDYHQPSSTFRLFPPYIISNEELDSFLYALDKLLP